ncbi:Protein TIS11 [Diplonema papillatum]|nr:Protein TIS11 [Diplonema papillatum]|eukprot:gene9161-14205_t
MSTAPQNLFVNTVQNVRQDAGASKGPENDCDELNNLNGAMLKTSVCRHWVRGYCKFGMDCGFAHGGTELRRPLKTALCRHFEHGHCRKGNDCGFAHGQTELGTPQAELLTIDSQEPLDPSAAELPTGKDALPASTVLVLSSKKKVWRVCTILAQDQSRYHVHYDGYSTQFDEWVNKSSDRTIAPGSIRAASEAPKVGAKVIVLSKRKRVWRQCTVIECQTDLIKVHYDGYSEQFDETLEAASDRIRFYDPLAVRRSATATSSMSGSLKSSLPGAARCSSDESQLLSIPNSSFAQTVLSSSAKNTASGGSERLLSQPRLVIPVAPIGKAPAAPAPFVHNPPATTCYYGVPPLPAAASSGPSPPFMLQPQWAGPTMSEGPASIPSNGEEDELSQTSTTNTSTDSHLRAFRQVSGDYTPFSTVKYPNFAPGQTLDVGHLVMASSESLAALSSVTPETPSLPVVVPALPPVLPRGPSAYESPPAFAPLVPTNVTSPCTPPSTFRHDPYAIQETGTNRSPSNGSN